MRRETNQNKEKNKKEKIKILAASDIHGDTTLAKQLAEKAKRENVDLVILCGDLTYAELSTKGIVGPFVKAGKQVLLIPGNHEAVATTNFLADFYGVKNIHGYSMKIGELGIFGCGGANVGPHEVSEKEISSLLRRGFEKVKDAKRKLMVTHVHPDGTLI
ncbi:MAG: metallophosphoesterase, partial [Nanoarchaeota archaeon]